MPVLLRDRTTLTRERVVAEVDCGDRRCGAQAGQHCIGRSGPLVSPHLARWHAWTARYSHLVLTKLPHKPPPRVTRALGYVIAQDDDWDALFPPDGSSAGGSVAVGVTSAVVDDPGAAFADLLNMTTVTETT